MLFKESVKKFKVYNPGDILGFHKYAYYGDLEKFEKLVNKTLINQYIESIWYCIKYGCLRNFEFAEYILNNIEFVDNQYKMNITATYIRNGEYDEKLFLDKYDYSLYKNIYKKDIEPLLKYEKLHNILYFISVLNSFELPISTTDLYPINKLKFYYNLPDNSMSKKLTDTSRFIISCPKYNKENLDSYAFSDPPGDYKNICNIERELLRIYLVNSHKESKVLKPLNEVNIINDVRFAIEAYSKDILINYCLTKFVIIGPLLALDLVEKHKPFLVLGNAGFDFDYLDKYIKINPLYIHNFIYSAIMYRNNINVKNYIGDEIDYCYIEACIKSCNYSVLRMLKNLNKKCYKKLDYSKNKYMNDPTEIEVDYDYIHNKLKLDISCYKYI